MIHTANINLCRVIHCGARQSLTTISVRPPPCVVARVPHVPGTFVVRSGATHGFAVRSGTTHLFRRTTKMFSPCVYLPCAGRKHPTKNMAHGESHFSGSARQLAGTTIASTVKLTAGFGSFPACTDHFVHPSSPHQSVRWPQCSRVVAWDPLHQRDEPHGVCRCATSNAATAASSRAANPA
jgi:hypothetical protein